RVLNLSPLTATVGRRIVRAGIVEVAVLGRREGAVGSIESERAIDPDVVRVRQVGAEFHTIDVPPYTERAGERGCRDDGDRRNGCHQEKLTHEKNLRSPSSA